MALTCKGNHPVKLLRNHVTLKQADRVDIHKYVESKDMASQQIGPLDWNFGRDTSKHPSVPIPTRYEIWFKSDIAPSVQAR
jgi:hypothetical protein